MVNLLKKLLIISFILNIAIFLTGVIISVNFVPIQDFDMLSKADKEKLLNKLAINYPLGVKLILGSVVICVVNVFFYFYFYLKRTKKAKLNFL